MIDEEYLNTNDFPFAERVRKRNSVMGKITEAYNKAVTPALRILRDSNNLVDDWEKSEIEKIKRESADKKRVNAREYYDAIKPHRDTYEAAIAEAARNNPLWKHETNE